MLSRITITQLQERRKYMNNQQFFLLSKLRDALEMLQQCALSEVQR